LINRNKSWLYSNNSRDRISKNSIFHSISLLLLNSLVRINIPLHNWSHYWSVKLVLVKVHLNSLLKTRESLSVVLNIPSNSHGSIRCLKRQFGDRGVFLLAHIFIVFMNISIPWLRGGVFCDWVTSIVICQKSKTKVFVSPVFSFRSEGLWNSVEKCS